MRERSVRRTSTGSACERAGTACNRGRRRTVRRRRGSRHSSALRQPLGDRALAQAGGPAEQQAMAEAAGVERRGGLVVDALLPWREARVIAHARPCHARKCATASRGDDVGRPRRIDHAEALRLGGGAREERRAHALEEIVVLAFDAIRMAGRGRARARGLRATPTSSSRVRPGCDADDAALQLGDEVRVQPAAAALVGIAGIGEAVADHPGAALQRRQDRLAHVLRARGEHQQQFGFRRRRLRRLRVRAAGRGSARPAACRRARGCRPLRSRRPATPSRNAFSTVVLPAPSPPSSDHEARMRRQRACHRGVRPCGCVLLAVAAAGSCARRPGARPASARTAWRPLPSPTATKYSASPGAGCAAACSAATPGIAIGVGGRPARV